MWSENVLPNRKVNYKLLPKDVLYLNFVLFFSLFNEPSFQSHVIKKLEKERDCDVQNFFFFFLNKRGDSKVFILIFIFY